MSRASQTQIAAELQNTGRCGVEGLNARVSGGIVGDSSSPFEQDPLQGQIWPHAHAEKGMPTAVDIIALDYTRIFWSLDDDGQRSQCVDNGGVVSDGNLARAKRGGGTER